jgi:hypothetical protein
LWDLQVPAEKQACLIDYSLLSIDYSLYPSFSKLDSDCSGRLTGNSCRTFYMPPPFGVFAAHKMTAADAMSEDFTGSGNFDSFFQTLMGFLFWHLNWFLKYKRGNLQHLRPPVNTTAWKFPKKMKNQLAIPGKSPFYAYTRN